MNIELIERTLEKIESVVSCRIILGENEEIEEVHIVSNGLRSAKQIARDIQSVLIATYDIQTDYKKISIAQIFDDSLKRPECRLKLESVSHDNSGKKATVKVALSNERNTYESSNSGINSSRNIERMLVDTTLKIVEEACGYEEVFTLEDVRTISLSSEKAVLVVVMSMLDGLEQRLCGSCLINNDYKEAVVKATLDAINRCISK